MHSALSKTSGLIQKTSVPEQTQEQILRQVQQMAALNQIVFASAATLDFQTMVDVLLEKIDRLLHYPFTTLRLFNQETGVFELKACRNLPTEEWKKRDVDVSGETAKFVIQSKGPVVIEDLRTDTALRDRNFFTNQGLTSGLRIPLIARGTILGILSFYKKERRGFSGDEVEFLSSLGSQVAIVLYSFCSFFPGTSHRKLLELNPGPEESPEVIREMSYEIRARLTPLLGYVGMMRDKILGEINPRQKRALDKVMTNAYELLTITEQLKSTRCKDLKEQVSTGSRPLREAIDELERDTILSALRQTSFNQTKAARLLGTTRSILRYRMRKLVINDQSNLNS